MNKNFGGKIMKIAKSLIVIVAVLAVAAGATAAVFTSQATVTGNTFATGTLEIRINGQSSIPGFSFLNAAPGDCKSGQFSLQNYGLPWFAGPSTLSAKTLNMSAAQTGGNTYLFDGLTIHMTKDAGGPPEDIWNSNLNTLINRDALVSYYHPGGLIPGSSETINYNVCLPLSADSSYQGLSTTFSFVADASSS
jgi:predicted ribosomally synthesized peptide with SipW-like signal peptide